MTPGRPAAPEPAAQPVRGARPAPPAAEGDPDRECFLAGCRRARHASAMLGQPLCNGAVPRRQRDPAFPATRYTSPHTLKAGANARLHGRPTTEVRMIANAGCPCTHVAEAKGRCTLTRYCPASGMRVCGRAGWRYGGPSPADARSCNAPCTSFPLRALPALQQQCSSSVVVAGAALNARTQSRDHRRPVEGAQVKSRTNATKGMEDDARRASVAASLRAVRTRARSRQRALAKHRSAISG